MNETVIFMSSVTPELSHRQNDLYAAIKDHDYGCERMEYVNPIDQDAESDSFCTELASDRDSNIFVLMLGEAVWHRP